MAITRIEESRIRILKDPPPTEEGEYVLYPMQQSQRAEHNPALEPPRTGPTSTANPCWRASG